MTIKQKEKAVKYMTDFAKLKYDMQAFDYSYDEWLKDCKKCVSLYNKAKKLCPIDDMYMFELVDGDELEEYRDSF